MTTFRIPCNWEPELLDALDGIPVSSLFGMVPEHVVGGGRPSAALRRINLDAAREYIGEARRRGFSFNYLFNAPCLDAREFTDDWRCEFLAHLDWALESGADQVTVAIPYLVEVIKKRHPDLHVTVSSYARISTPQRAAYFESLGADDLTLDPISVTRDFPRLAAVAKTVDCAVTLIANGLCLLHCPFAEYHAVLMAHSSQKNHPSGGRYDEYPFYNCTERKLRDPVELIRAGFIRPEDLGAYEAIGITNFKLVDRTRPTTWLTRVFNAYTARQYDGDLLEIVNFPHFFLSMLYHQAGLDGTPVFPRIDNRALDGLLEALREHDCAAEGCAGCDICARYAERAVTRPEGTATLVNMLEAMRERLMFS